MTTVDKKTSNLSTRQVSHLTEVAETIRDDALTTACRKLLIFYSPEVKSLLAKSDFFDYFKHALASGVAGVLADNDDRVQAVYIQDTTSNPDSEIAGALPADATVSLIIQVTTSSAALEGFITSLDRALIASLKELDSPRFAEREFILDVVVVTQHEVEQGIGYGHMMKSIFAPPLKVWQREG